MLSIERQHRAVVHHSMLCEDIDVLE